VAKIKAFSQPTRKTALPADQFSKVSASPSAIDFEHAYRLYNRRVYANCLYMVGNAADAEDLTQEVFLQVFRKIDSFRGESAFSTWLYRVAVNIVLVRLRRKSLNMTSLEEITESKEAISSMHNFLGAPDRVLMTAIDRLSLEHAFSQMPPGYRQVFLMHYVEGYGHREIARILGLSVGTSKSQLYKARCWLCELLGAEESHPPRRRVRGRPRHAPQEDGHRRRPCRHSSHAGACG
jgi:RNA polymerase sigma-70 factor (ECF subfamily)